MKVIIQIPCFNEENTLPDAIRDLPRELPGVDIVEWLIIDDGSTDRTSEVARKMGVDHIVRHQNNRGLAAAFMTGLDACIDHDADIIVNTDADNQYCAEDIPLLIAPIVEGVCDIVVGARPIMTIRHFSLLKKLLQCAGSWIVRRISTTQVSDAPSGFRAFSRESAMRLNVFSDYTYTIETIIQAGQKDMTIVSVPIRVNSEGTIRPSRLVKNVLTYLYQSLSVIVRIFMIYRPFRFFSILGSVPFAAGLFLGGRFLWHFFILGEHTGKIQSLILASLLMSFGFLLFILALLADLISVNRKLLEKLDWRMRQSEEDGRHARAIES